MVGIPKVGTANVGTDGTEMVGTPRDGIGGTEPEQDRFFDAAPELITALKETAG